MRFRAAVGQFGSVLFDTERTLARIERSCRAAAEAGARLLVLPEAILGGYPKGLTFGALVGSRSAEGREQFLRYANASIRLPGPETEQLIALCKELNLHLVLGVIERELGTLYCTSLLLSPDRGLIAKHRKLMPTASERLIWGQGDGSTMQVTETELGRIGMASCWENYMPLEQSLALGECWDHWAASFPPVRPSPGLDTLPKPGVRVPCPLPSSPRCPDAGSPHLCSPTRPRTGRTARSCRRA